MRNASPLLRGYSSSSPGARACDAVYAAQDERRSSPQILCRRPRKDLAQPRSYRISSIASSDRNPFCSGVRARAKPSATPAELISMSEYSKLR